MKRATIFFFLLWGFLLVQRPVYALDVAFATNGVVVAVPVEMPVVGVRLDTGAVVYNLHGADSATRAACGYYSIVRFDRSAMPSNKVVAARAWKIEGGKAVETATLSDKPVRVALSRRKLSQLVKKQKWTAKFTDFINADPEIAVRWYSGERLVAGSEEMRPFIEGFAALVGVSYEQALQLLEGCRED